MSVEVVLARYQPTDSPTNLPQCPKVKVAEYEPNLISICDPDLVLGQIPEVDRGIFLALAHLGLRPGEARALEVDDYHDEWITVDKAVKGKVPLADPGLTTTPSLR